MVSPEIVYTQDSLNRLGRLYLQMHAFVHVYNNNNKRSHQFEEESRGVGEGLEEGKGRVKQSNFKCLIKNNIKDQTK